MTFSYKKFNNINLEDKFFDSLRQDYEGFDEWFKKKDNELAYVSFNDDQIDGFLYLKEENEKLSDTCPPLPVKKRLKLGTLKIEARGTKLGERFVKKVFDHAVSKNIDEIYVTVFDKHESLISLLKRYGFVKRATKNHMTPNGQEGVYFKVIGWEDKALLENYPSILLKNRNFLLSLYPQWHSRLLPDSILNNESPEDIVTDVSHTNSIHKVYLTKMRGTGALRSGDNLLIYRTTDNKGPAKYRSVATSVCVVEEVRDIKEFDSYESFKKYCGPYSIFSEKELQRMYKEKTYNVIIRFTYNFALNKRVTREKLMSITGYDNNAYWGFLNLDNASFKKILEEGDVNEGFVVHQA